MDFEEGGGRDHDARAMTMGMFSSGTQKAILLQPNAKKGAHRISAIQLRHCTTETVAKETSIIVDVATTRRQPRRDRCAR